MWLFTTKGFYSVVEHRDDPDMLLIRCRAKGDLEALKRDHIPTLEIVRTRRADYRFRALVPRREWLNAMVEMGDEIDYDNFKNRVKERQGKDRAWVYEDVWRVLRRLQQSRWSSFIPRIPKEPLGSEVVDYGVDPRTGRLPQFEVRQVD